MKLKLSDKDYLIALGILVAVIVMLTTLVYSDKSDNETKNTETPIQRKTGLNASPSVLIKKVVEKLDFKSYLHNNP